MIFTVNCGQLTSTTCVTYAELSETGCCIASAFQILFEYTITQGPGKPGKTESEPDTSAFGIF